jgi:hypothetical protein
MHINTFKQSIGYGNEYHLKHSDMLYDEFFIVTNGYDWNRSPPDVTI